MKKNRFRFRATFSASMLLLLLLLATFNVLAQSRPVSGRVVANDNDSSIAGATVRVKGQSVSTLTDRQGNFTINAEPNSVLVVSSIGFSAQEVPIKTLTTINVRLITDPQSLQQVVVVGYGTTKRKDLTGAVASVTSAQIEQVPVTTLDQAIQGRAPGVQVTNNDGAPGGNVSVLIRGIGNPSSGGNSPLYVVDGYPVVTGINNINPNDIATIDILKDASAAAIYGIRAASGVVIITTKKGRKNGTQISLDAYTSYQSRPKRYKILNAQQWATLANEVADADPQHNFAELPIWRTPDALTNVDWQKALFRNGLTQNYNVAIRGGSDKVQSAVSIGYYDQKGIVQGSYFKRATLGLNLDYQPTTWLRSSTNVHYAYQDANNPFGTGSIIQVAQLPPTLDSGNKLTSQIKDANGNYGFFNPKNTYVAKFGNPLFNIENNRYYNITNYILANSSLEATLFSGFRIKTNAGINLNMNTNSYYQPEDNRLNDQYNLGGATQNALYSRHLHNTFDWLWENTIAYDRTFGEHAIHFVGGISAQKTVDDYSGGSGIPPNSSIRDLAQVRNLQLDANNGAGGPGNGQTVLTLASQFGRLSYSFLDRYIITGTIRRDGSSRFNQDHQWGVFPSGAVAWKIKEERFLQPVSWLTDLKLRGSYGILGNQGSIGLYQFQDNYSTGGPATLNPGNLGYPFNKIYQNGIAPTQPANPYLKWETDYQTDIGLDAAFLNGELTVTADWYHRIAKDFLLNLQASSQTGFLFLTRNVGEIDNKGFELGLNYNHSVNKDFRYGVGVTFTTIKNKLVSIVNGTKSIVNYGGLTLAGIGWGTFTNSFVGQPIGEFYGYKSIGIIQTQAQIDALNQSAAKNNPSNPYYQKSATGPGDRLFADINGDGQVTPDDQTSLGSPIPKFYGGVSMDATYKNFDFNVYFYGVYGNKILNYVKSSLQSFQNRSFVGVQNVSYEYYVNHWTPNNPSNTYSRATYNDDAVGSGVPSSAWIENGSFLKLKNLTVGYTLPSALLKRIFINRVRIYVSTQNLFTITKYSGLDPEIGIQNGNATQNGVDNGTYPSSRFYTAGINVTF